MGRPTEGEEKRKEVQSGGSFQNSPEELSIKINMSMTHNAIRSPTIVSDIWVVSY